MNRQHRHSATSVPGRCPVRSGGPPVASFVGCALHTIYLLLIYPFTLLPIFLFTLSLPRRPIVGTVPKPGAYEQVVIGQVHFAVVVEIGIEGMADFGFLQQPFGQETF